MKNYIVLVSLAFFFFTSCKKTSITESDQVIILDRSIDSFVLTPSPVGESSSDGFMEFSNGSKDGFISLFKKTPFGKADATANKTNIDFIYYLTSLSSTSSQGKVHFVNPWIFNENFGSNYNLGWNEYSDKPVFIALYSKESYAPDLYYALREEEFDKIISPDEIKSIGDHSLNLRNGETSNNLSFDYGQNGKTDKIQIFGVRDSRGYLSLIKILPETNIFNLRMMVKRSYSTK